MGSYARCEIDQSATNLPGGGVDLSIRCKTSGKPITVSNSYGMFCEDMCDLQECKDAKVEFDKFFNGMMGAWGVPKDE